MKNSFAIYKSLDLGPGDKNIPPASQAKETVRELIKMKYGLTSLTPFLSTSSSRWHVLHALPHQYIYQ